jgi:hypothetical protein
MADLKIDIATAFTGAKQFKKADSATTSLEKNVSKLGKTLLATFGAAKILQFAKSSAKAFIEDEAAASKLAQSVKNLGLAYASDDIRKYIDSLTLATGVADKELRPALQALLQVTGSVTKSQAMLSDAINISRGSGVDLATVANDLSQAYVGNLKGLRKYNLGLTKAELAASSFADIQKRMNDLFSGASTAYLQTYAGQMQILSNTANEAQEVIGKSLVDAIASLSGDLSVQGIADQMMNLANNTGDAITGLSVVLGKINTLGGLKTSGGGFDLLKTLLLVTNPAYDAIAKTTGFLVKTGKSAKAAKGTFNFASGGGLGTGGTTSITDRQAAAAEAAAKKRQAELLAAQKKQTKAIKEQTALKKAGTLFDIEQIGIIAALKANVSAEDRKRLELQLAILTGNTSEASKLAGEIAKSQGLSKDLAAYLANLPDAKNPFSAWKTYLDMLEAQVRTIASIQPGGMTPNYNGAAIDAITATYGAGGASAGVSKGGDVYISVAGSVVSESDLVDMVNNGLLNRSLSGSPSAIGRLKGSFAG